MAITPEEIRNVTFSAVRFEDGYDESEVDNFLDEAESRVANGQAPIGMGRFPKFSRTWLRVGYRVDSVDQFVGRLADESGMSPTRDR